MSGLTYSAVSGAEGLYHLSGTTPADNKFCWAGYLEGAGGSLGNLASLEDVWVNLLGTYVFLPKAPTDPGKFTTYLKAFLAVQPTRFMWILNPDAAASAWQTWLAPASYQQESKSWGISAPARFAVNSDYHLLLNSGCLVSLHTEAGSEHFSLTMSSVNFKSHDFIYPAQNDLTIPLNGDTLGSFLFNIELSNGWKQQGDMDMLGVKLCYATPQPGSLDGGTFVLKMPILKQSNDDLIAIKVTLDLLNSLVADRTSLSFIPANPVHYPTFYSSLVTTKGYRINLIPKAPVSQNLWAGRFAFGKTPKYVPDEGHQGEGEYSYHLSPDGLFSISVVITPAESKDGNQLMLGISGTESITLEDSTDSLIFYRAGQNAYVPASKDKGLSAPTDDGTTSYATLLPSAAGHEGLTYYAQPIQAPLFQAATTLSLDFHEMPGGALPTYGEAGPTTKVMPLGAYLWVDSRDLSWVRLFEEAVFAKERRNAIATPVQGGGISRAIMAVHANPDLAITPNGLVAKLSADRNFWEGIVLGNMPESLHKEVQLTQVKPDLQKGLQANQLFFVVSNVDTFMKQTSIQYQLTDDDISQLVTEGVSNHFIGLLKTAYGKPPTKIYDTEEDFLVNFPSDNNIKDYKEYKKKVLAVAGLLICDMDSWSFQLSPRAWRTDPKNPTVVLFKFCNRPITSLIQDANSWGWPEAAYDGNDKLDTTQGILQEIVNYAEQRSKKGTGKQKADDPFAIFYNEVLNNPMWNGVLFLNVAIDFTKMPAELEFLSAGIDTSQFYAHHIGFSVTPFTPTAHGIELKQTAAFGLINYDNPQDLVASKTIPFGFKTLQLQVRFANARVASFAAQVELMVNDLFGAPLVKKNPERGNNLIMIGSYQRVGGTPSYSFSLSGQNDFLVHNAALVDFEVLSVFIKTGGDVGNNVKIQFILTGNMRFAQLKDFDMFSFGPDATTDTDGYLRFGGMDITMNFDRDLPADQTFSVDQGAISFDLINSVVRSRSLVDNFALVISHLIVSPNLAKEGDPPAGQSPEALGFTSIACPLDQTPMPAGWTGLVYKLDLGTLGALAGGVGLTVKLLVAWSPGASPSDMPVYLGLQLPNIPSVGGSIPIQGILKIGFRSFEFTTYPADHDELGYILTLHRFALSVLCFSFPPGNNYLQIFGAPGNPKSSVGWFAAYENDDKKSGEGSQSTHQTQLLDMDKTTPVIEHHQPAVNRVERRLLTGRRTPTVD